MFCVLLLFAFIKTGLSINSHQFHFSGGNVLYGKVPRSIHIVGYWYIHRNDSTFQELFEKKYTEQFLMGRLYICKNNVEMKLLEASSMGAKREKSRKINQLISSGDKSMVIQPFITNIADCEVLRLDDHEIKTKQLNESVIVKRFKIVHEFKKHSSVLFVDAFGVAAFHYRAKHTDAQKLKFCENDEISFPVIFNKRPICPRPVIQSTVVDNGLLTIYKPNILSIQKKAYRCYLETTLITTYTNIVNRKENNLPLTTKVEGIVDSTECLKWIKTNSCDHPVFKEKIYRLAYDLFNGTIRNLSDTRMSTVNKLELKYTYMWYHEYQIANCVIDVGYVRTTPPFNNILTPWGHISSDYLYESNYTYPGGEVVVWDAFEKEDLCNYVPMSSFDVKRIVYKTRDFLDEDPNPGATEMYHFVSDAVKSVYTSDDTQITSHELFNCIDDEKDQILYAINDGLILSWRKGYALNDDEDDSLDADIYKSQIKYHAHYAFDDVTKIFDRNDYSKISSLSGGKGNNGCETEEDMSSPHCRQSYESSPANKLDGTLSNEDIVSVRNETTKPTVSPKDQRSTLFGMINFLAFKLKDFQNQDTIRRAQMWCENQQHLYDLQLLVAQTSPSTIISSYINRPVYAERIGNGVYDTYYCDVIDDFIVIDNLFVANKNPAPKIRVPLEKLYKRAGVDIDEDRCFTMPIIIFREKSGRKAYKIGQMNHDNTISTISMPWVEDCKYGRYFFHYIGQNVHYFQDYKLQSVTDIDHLYDYASRLQKNIKHLERIRATNSTVKRENIEPLLENTRFVDIHTKYQPPSHKPIVLGFQNTAIYSYKQKRKVISSIEALLANANSARFDDKKLKIITGSKKIITGGSGDFASFISGVASGVKVLVRGVGGIAETIVDTGGDFFENIIETGGGVVETAFETGGNVVGSAVDRASDVLGSVADFFSGGFMKIILVIVAVAAVGLFLYYIVKKKLLSDDNNTVVYPSYTHPPPQLSMHETKFKNQSGLEKRITHEYINDF